MLVKKIIKACLALKIATAVVLMPTELGAENDYRYLIFVKLSERKLYLFEGDDKNIRTYQVAVPRRNYYRSLSGELIRIEKNPLWYPTAKTRAAYLKAKKVELPAVVAPFGRDSRNAMGKAKMIIKFNQVVDPIRIHGTNDPESIGKKISRGCIRMRNQDILELAEIVKNSRTKVKVIINN